MRRLDGARKMLNIARVQVRELDDRTYQLTNSTGTLRSQDRVWEKYMLWLVCIRQVAVSIHHACVEAGQPESFGSWWRTLFGDDEHRFFRDERNDVLKQVANTIRVHSTEDGDGREIGYWVFRRGPFDGLPLAPVCQRYTERVYDEMVVPASELLWPVVLSRGSANR